MRDASPLYAPVENESNKESGAGDVVNRTSFNYVFMTSDIILEHVVCMYAGKCINLNKRPYDAHCGVRELL